MSKIEKALSRARQSNKTAMVKVPAAVAADTDVGADGDGRKEMVAVARSTAVSSYATSASAIARMKEASLRAYDDLAHFGIIAPEVGENATVQAFRELRTRVLQHTKGQNAVILVTSALTGGGSSFVTTNLGVAFAFDAGRTALLVDCNLRNPNLHRMSNDTSSTGITDYLESTEVEVGDIIHPVGIERLRVIPAGSKRDIPTEYFTTARVKELFDAMRSRYPERFILIDAPPMTESADTQILIDLCDYVLLVVPYGKTTNTQIDHSVKAIDSRKLIGIVFNNEPRLPPVRYGLQDAKQTLSEAWQHGRERLHRVLRRVKSKKGDVPENGS